MPPQPLHAGVPVVLQDPALLPQATPLPTQIAPLQQPEVQVALAQQASPAPPQFTNAPWPLQILFAVDPFSPGGTHSPVVESRQAPAVQAVPDAQGGW